MDVKDLINRTPANLVTVTSMIKNCKLFSDDLSVAAESTSLSSRIVKKINNTRENIIYLWERLETYSTSLSAFAEDLKGYTISSEQTNTPQAIQVAQTLYEAGKDMERLYKSVLGDLAYLLKSLHKESQHVEELLPTLKTSIGKSVLGVGIIVLTAGLAASDVVPRVFKPYAYKKRLNRMNKLIPYIEKFTNELKELKSTLVVSGPIVCEFLKDMGQNPTPVRAGGVSFNLTPMEV
ncbi:hypothetical protein DFA_09279 [Cavenderia fasciculata]|uniref:Uncharacterized protein n=1 Tax=Cavenderia fasciculata TaxID=261658 RepID=F4Q767_CACFS|nr:uncharacterized protein DFA_09279 [Cavenderia fasciculata]EGG16249.1 hypothetical protein DFA_09279 [Cavenderia fasciculata]|eukprot:XP_004354633.1 hypothetical protein DFA_09279 [Cavenderia fasciculata]